MPGVVRYRPVAACVCCAAGMRARVLALLLWRGYSPSSPLRKRLRHAYLAHLPSAPNRAANATPGSNHRISAAFRRRTCVGGRAKEVAALHYLRHYQARQAATSWAASARMQAGGAREYGVRLLAVCAARRGTFSGRQATFGGCCWRTFGNAFACRH
jgi:hypothetical protein